MKYPDFQAMTIYLVFALMVKWLVVNSASSGFNKNLHLNIFCVDFPHESVYFDDLLSFCYKATVVKVRGPSPNYRGYSSSVGAQDRYNVTDKLT